MQTKPPLGEWLVGDEHEQNSGEAACCWKIKIERAGRQPTATRPQCSAYALGNMPFQD